MILIYTGLYKIIPPEKCWIAYCKAGYFSLSSISLLFFHQRKPIKPTRAKGMIIKYKIPLFKPWAGFSPSCCAVLVQREHCAFAAGRAKNKDCANSKNMIKHFFIR